MKLSKLILLGLTAASVFLITGCQNSTAEDAKKTSPSQTIHTDEKQSEPVTADTDLAEADNEQSEPDAADSVHLKSVYFGKLEDAKAKTEEMDANLDDSSTAAMKEFEGELYSIWDGLLNEIYGVLEEQLAPENMEALRVKQREWITFRDTKAKEGSLKYQRGSLASLEYVSLQTKLTMVRCFDLVAQYMP